MKTNKQHAAPRFQNAERAMILRKERMQKIRQARMIERARKEDPDPVMKDSKTGFDYFDQVDSYYSDFDY